METTSERVPLEDGATLASGDIVEVELHLKSDNDYDYVVFEDMKPAGCEAVETRSGTAYGDLVCVPTSSCGMRRSRSSSILCRRASGGSPTSCGQRSLASSMPCRPMHTPCTPRTFRALSDEFRVTVHGCACQPVLYRRKAGKTRHK